MNEIDFQTLHATISQLYRSSVVVSSVIRRLNEKYTGGIHAELTSGQAGEIIDLAEKIAAIDLQIGPLMTAKVKVEHEQAEPGK